MPDQREKAIDLMRQQRFAEAVPLFVQLIQSDPTDWSLFYMVGQCYRFSGDLPAAVRTLQRAADLNSEEAQVFFALGISLQLSDAYSAAIVALERAVQLEPNLFSAYNSIGLTYRKMGDVAKALEWYSHAAEGVVGLAMGEATKDRARSFREEIVDGKKVLAVLPHALEKTKQILCSEPMYAVLKNNIGQCLIELGDVNGAKSAFRESIEFIPEGYNFPDPLRHLESIS